jgi:hypothetical protein
MNQIKIRRNMQTFPNITVRAVTLGPNAIRKAAQIPLGGFLKLLAHLAVVLKAEIKV